MQEYLRRMKTEAQDLDGKIAKAKKAIANPPYGCDEIALNYLKEQVDYMQKYSVVLHKRIEYATDKNN